MRLLARFGAVLCAATCVSSVSGQDFAFDDDGSKISVADRGLPVLVYVYRSEPVATSDGGSIPALVNYFHPLHGLYGEVITGDTPSNRSGAPGISWGWTRLGAEGRVIDIARGDGGKRVFERVTIQDARADRAVFGVQNAWVTEPGGTAQVLEYILVTVWKVDKAQRSIDVSVILRSVSTSPVFLEGTIPGSGLSFQLNPERSDWMVAGGQGEYAPQDQPYLSPWVVCSYRDDRRSTRSGLAVFQDSRNPGFSQPNWLVQAPAGLNAGVPGTVKAELKPGQSLEFRYRFILHHLGSSKVDMTAEYTKFIAEGQRRE